MACGLLLLSPSAIAQKNKPPKPLPGRLYLADGSMQPAQLVLIDCDQMNSISSDGMERAYSPDEVSSFGMGVDSFTVLRDFYITLTRDAQHYNSSFMRVCAAGAGLELYEFRGSMTRNQNSGGNGGRA